MPSNKSGNKSEITRVYFSHDQDAQDDDKITKLFFEFRKLVKTLERDDLEQLAGLSGYSIFWSILEYMHRNSFTVDDIDLLADKLRIKPEFVKLVLNNFKFFRREQDMYISDRLLGDIAKAKDKSKSNQTAASVRWLLSAYSTAYEKQFGIKPVLSQPDKNALIQYSNQIEDFKSLIPKILKKLSSIKFNTDIGFQGRSNWLLKEDHLAQIVNGQYGDIVTAKKETPKPAPEPEQAHVPEPVEDNIDFENIASKGVALELIIKNFGRNFNIRFLPQDYKALVKRFDITQKELNNGKIG